jgi:hypothetical protein
VVKIDVLLHGPALATERKEILDGLGGAQGRRFDELDVGTQSCCDVPVHFQLV